jgi:hypothetical protein
MQLLRRGFGHVGGGLEAGRAGQSHSQHPLQRVQPERSCHEQCQSCRVLPAAGAALPPQRLASSVGMNTVPSKSGSLRGVSGPVRSTAVSQALSAQAACASGVNPGSLLVAASCSSIMLAGGRPGPALAPSKGSALRTAAVEGSPACMRRRRHASGACTKWLAVAPELGWTHSTGRCERLRGS